MKEGRKFGISAIVASQGLADFHQDFLGNSGMKVVFRINCPESRCIAGFILGAPRSVPFEPNRAVGRGIYICPDTRNEWGDDHTDVSV
jgi:DNA helicase HerA-like ATPase